MNWSKLYFGKLKRIDILKAVADPIWQETRLCMKGTTLHMKYEILEQWLKKNNYSRSAQIQVTNYITALSKNGLIKVSDYRGL